MEQPAKAFLKRCAKNRQIPNYAELGEFIGLNVNLSRDRRILGEILAKVSEKTMVEEGVMLSAIVVGKNNGLPSDGFFDLAKHMKRRVRNKANFWIYEYNRVFKAYE